MQIPSLSLLASRLAASISVTVIPLRNPHDVTSTGLGGLDMLDPAGASLRFRTLTRRTIDLLRQRHRVQPFDLLHAYWLFEPGAVAVAAGRILGIPAVVSVGGAELVSLPELGYGGQRTRRGRLLNTAVMRSAALVTGGSEYVLDLARSAAPTIAPRLRLAPLPVALAAPVSVDRPSSGRQDGGPRLLQVGAYLPVKGQDLSIRALAELCRSVPGVSLTVIGEDPHGYRRRMQALANNLGLADSVMLLDRIPHDQLTDHFQSADLLLMPSRHESQGMVVLEAASHSLPTAGADVGVVRDLAPEAAAAFPAGDWRALATVTARLLDDPERSFALAGRARQAAEDRYSVEPSVRRWLDLYEDAIDGR